MKRMGMILPLLLVLFCCGCGEEEFMINTTSLPSEEELLEMAGAVAMTDEDDTEDEEEPTNAAFPTADENAVTFDDGDFSFASVITDDDEAVAAILSIEEVDGNAMLKYTPNEGAITEENIGDMVEKISINATQLLGTEGLANVYSISFDLYAIATEEWYVNEDGESVQVAGWIGGGGGTECADGTWYSFADFAGSSINEYELARTDACTVTFKFLLAASGKCWDETMEDANFLIMRWGMENLSCLYIDNITFYDVNGSSIPLASDTDGDTEQDEDDENLADSEEINSEDSIEE